MGEKCTTWDIIWLKKFKVSVWNILGGNYAATHDDSKWG